MNGNAENGRNASGAKDPTACAAISQVTAQEARKNQFVKVARQLAELCGFEIVGRFTLRDRKTGRIWE